MVWHYYMHYLGKYKDPMIGKMENLPDSLIDILKALHYCHKVAKIYHRNIKPDNIMINHSNEAILIDFGLSIS